MKRNIIFFVAVLIAAVGFFASDGHTQMGPGPGMMGGGYGPGYGMGPGMMGGGYDRGYGGNYCPWCGQPTGPSDGYGMGPGMMEGGYGPGYGRGYGMRSGMMGGGMMGGGYGRGYGMGPGMMGPGYGYDQQYGPQRYGNQPQRPQQPLTSDQAKQEVENYVSALRNPNLKVGKVEEKGDDYQVDVETKDGSLVDKMLVDKDTGRMRSMY